MEKEIFNQEQFGRYYRGQYFKALQDLTSFGRAVHVRGRKYKCVFVGMGVIALANEPKVKLSQQARKDMAALQDMEGGMGATNKDYLIFTDLDDFESKYSLVIDSPRKARKRLQRVAYTDALIMLDKEFERLYRPAPGGWPVVVNPIEKAFIQKFIKKLTR